MTRDRKELEDMYHKAQDRGDIPPDDDIEQMLGKLTKSQCKRCGAILEPMQDTGHTLVGFPVIIVPACPRCGWNAKSKESVN